MSSALKRFWIIPLFLLLSFPARGNDVSALVDQLQKSYDSIQTVNATFQQTYRSLRFDAKENSGKLVIKKPGQMRWDYETPKGRVLVADGKWITLYDPDDRQAIVAEQPKEEGLPIAISFLAGRGKLKDKFKVTMQKDLREDSGEFILRCDPITPEPNLSEVYLTVRTKKPMMVTATLIVDALGGENEITFSKITSNRPVAKETFAFKPPSGTPVVSMPTISPKL